MRKFPAELQLYGAHNFNLVECGLTSIIEKASSQLQAYAYAHKPCVFTHKDEFIPLKMQCPYCITGLELLAV